MSVFEKVEQAQFPKEEVSICLRQDLEKEISALLREQRTVAREINEEDQRLGQSHDVNRGNASELEERIQELEKVMADSVITFHMQGVSSPEYNRLQRTAGRPNKDSKADQALGYDVENFYRNAIKRCTYKITDVDGNEDAQWSDAQWQKLWTSISDAQFDQLAEGVQKVNRKVARTPTPARISETARDSEQNQELLTNLASATSDSLDGSPENASLF